MICPASLFLVFNLPHFIPGGSLITTRADISFAALDTSTWK